MTLLDHFAEHLSRHGDVERAAIACGRSKSRATAQLRRLCAELGEQAR